MSERDLFIAALQQEGPAQCQAYLDEACAGRPELRRQVEHLLRLHESAGSFLEQPAAQPPATQAFPAAEPAGPPEGAGALVGPYQLIERIGEGGMGAVWLAQQTEPVKRLVAVKLIKAGMDSKQVVARFEAERQALALMDHPHIARVLDGGTTAAGRPYFVMELVKGVPITRYCDERRLTPRQRLELFVPVCQAVQHAHQKGIIHRDLKPSNVLVALYDGRPVPKVIDFGVAKAAGQPLTERTLVTGFGNLVGTPEYMSPEQAETNQLDIDTRSDIYSLGVLLYELLTGSPPFTRKESEYGGILELLRAVREQEPARPSAKLSTAKGLPALAANRGTEPAKLTRLVRGELDWIALKALEKDRGRRYETANGFARDVQRYLNDEPVQACPPSAWYRCRKFARRNKRALLTAALLAAMLLAVAGIFGWTARDRAARRGRNAEAVAALLGQCETALRTDRADQAAVALGAAERRAADGGAEGLAGRLARCRTDLELLRKVDDIDTFRWTWGGRAFPAIRAVAARWRAVLADYGVAPDKASAKEAAGWVSRSLVRDRVLAAVDGWLGTDPSAWVRAVLRSADPDPYRDVVRDAMAARDGRAVAAQARRPAALHQPPWFAAMLAASPRIPVERRRAVLESALRTRPGNLELLMDLGNSYPMNRREGADERVRWFQAALAARPDNLAARNSLGAALRDKGDPDGAIAHFEEVIRRNPKFALGHYNVGVALGDKGRRNGAIAAYRAALKADPEYALAHYNLAHGLRDRGDLAGALHHFKEASRLDPKDERAPYNLGKILMNQGDREGAIAAYRAAIQADPTEDYPHIHLGYALLEKGDPDGAIAAFLGAIRADPNAPGARRGLDLARKARGTPDEALAAYRAAVQAGVTRNRRAGHPDPLTALSNLAKAYHAVDKLPEAIRLYEQVKRAREKELGADHLDTVNTLVNLAGAYRNDGKAALAVRLLEQVKEILKRKKLQPDHPDTLTTLHSLAVAYLAASKWTEAIRLLEQIKDIREKELGADHPDTLKTLTNLAAAYQRDGKVALAIRLLEQVKESQEKKFEADHPATLHTLESLAHAYKADGKLRDAIRLYERVKQARERQLGAGHRFTMLVVNNLAVAYWSARQLDRSLPLFEDLLERMEARVGRDHPSALATRANLGVNYCEAGRPDEGLPLLEEAYRKGKLHAELAWVGEALVFAYAEAGRTAEAAALLPDWLASARKSLPADSLHLAGTLASAADQYLKLKQYPKAERLLRECLTIREKKAADSWTTFNARSLLGGALAGQKKYADAEPLLLKGYEGMKQRAEKMLPRQKKLLRRALERLVQLYEAWGNPDQANEWRKKLEAHRQGEKKAPK
jgi:serine/threonine protein kinase/tetratricopeptide (TPR) repeat protein